MGNVIVGINDFNDGHMARIREIAAGWAECVRILRRATNDAIYHSWALAAGHMGLPPRLGVVARPPLSKPPPGGWTLSPENAL